MKEKGLQCETVPPGNHQRNPAKKAIQKFKSHFTATLNGVNEHHPKDTWDPLIPQTDLTLELLRPCSVNEAHSACLHVHGPHDFNAHPLAPLGCQAIVHERAAGKGGERGTWANQGKPGCCLRPVMHSHQLWEFHIPETIGTVESDAAEFFARAQLPSTTVESKISDSLQQIKCTLKDLKPAQTVVTEDNGAVSTVWRLQEMHSKPVMDDKNAVTPPRVGKKVPATPPRVQKKEVKELDCGEINDCCPKKKQWFPTGTRMRVVEKIKGQRKILMGQATKCDPHTGLHHVVFPDGEWEEFDDDEMTCFCLVKSHTPRTPTTFANQLTISGFFPKASGNPSGEFIKLGEQCGDLHGGLNVGSMWDKELHK